MLKSGMGRGAQKVSNPLKGGHERFYPVLRGQKNTFFSPASPCFCSYRSVLGMAYCHVKSIELEPSLNINC